MMPDLIWGDCIATLEIDGNNGPAKSKAGLKDG
jgi:hypothetical protein